MSNFRIPPPRFFCLSEWVRIGQDPPSPRRRNLGYHPPPPHPSPVPLGILAAYRLYLVDVPITYHACETHNSLQLKIKVKI